MKLIKEINGKNYLANAKCVKEFSALSKVSKKILELLKDKSMYPKEIAKKLKIHEQNVYYYIKKLEKNGFIEIEKSENINGTFANYYALSSDAFIYEVGEFKESSKIHQKESKYLNPFIENGELNSLIIVGSPDPHGPLKARSRDGYFGMDLALFLGSFLSYVPNSKVKLDTEVTDKEMKENNLIIIGGPIVNKASGLVNDKMPIYYDEDKKGVYSKLSKKTYFSEEVGYINKFENPFNCDKNILLVSGLRNSGTKSAILAFLKHFDELKQGNNFKKKIHSRVVEGIDLDSDGIVDDCEFLE